MNTKVRDESAGKCPFNHIAGVGRTNRDWWPNQLRLELGSGAVAIQYEPRR